MDGLQLIYFADPMCSWCYGFSPVVRAMRQRFGEVLPMRLIMGGLRPGTADPMPEAARRNLVRHWGRDRGDGRRSLLPRARRARRLRLRHRPRRPSRGPGPPHEHGRRARHAGAAAHRFLCRGPRRDRPRRPRRRRRRPGVRSRLFPGRPWAAVAEGGDLGRLRPLPAHRGHRLPDADRRSERGWELRSGHPRLQRRRRDAGRRRDVALARATRRRSERRRGLRAPVSPAM